MGSVVTCVVWGYGEFTSSDIKLKWENDHWIWTNWADSL